MRHLDSGEGEIAMMNKQRALRKFLTVEVIILIITVVVGLIAIPYSILREGLSSTEQAVLAVLVLLATAQLANNYLTMKQEEKTDAHYKAQQDIAQIIKSFSVGVLKPRADVIPLEKFTERAQEILIIARTASTVAAQINFFHKQLERGCRLRFVVISPDACQHSDIEPVMPRPLTGNEAVDIFRAQLTSALSHIRYLKKLSEETAGKVEVRLINYASNLSFVVVDNDKRHGKIIVELTPYKCEELERPHVLLASDDPNTHWYSFFRDICDEIWDNATPIE